MELLVLRPDPEQESSASRFEVVVIASEIWAAERFERSEIWAACVIFMSSSSGFNISTETFNCSSANPDGSIDFNTVFDFGFWPKNIWNGLHLKVEYSVYFQAYRLHQELWKHYNCQRCSCVLPSIFLRNPLEWLHLDENKHALVNKITNFPNFLILRLSHYTRRCSQRESIGTLWWSDWICHT